MKKNILVFTILTCACLTELTAQYVVIPDTLLQERLMSLYPMCFDSTGAMDTTCYEIVDEDSLDVSGLWAISLEGLQYFDKLRYLLCDRQQCEHLPRLSDSIEYLDCTKCIRLQDFSSLPANLKILKCGICFLHSLPELPSKLEYLDCMYNPLSVLPALPSYLKTLICFSNQLTTLPTLPDSLHFLHCQKNQITVFPPFPDFLYELNCSTNLLDSLPLLPLNLREFSCWENSIDEFPPLPASLQTLTCAYNNLSFLPLLPPNLTVLDCGYNQITQLPSLPQTLKELLCTGNNLESLPSFPDSIVRVRCANNPLLSCLPHLPESLESLCIGGTAINCFPNQVTVLGCTCNLLQLPLCNDSCSYNPFLDIEKEKEFSSVSVFPNPVGDILTVQNIDLIENAEIYIYDLLGNQILFFRKEKVAGSIDIDFNSIPKGSYCLKMVWKGGTMSKKIIKI